MRTLSLEKRGAGLRPGVACISAVCRLAEGSGFGTDVFRSGTVAVGTCSGARSTFKDSLIRSELRESRSRFRARLGGEFRDNYRSLQAVKKNQESVCFRYENQFFLGPGSEVPVRGVRSSGCKRA